MQLEKINPEDFADIYEEMEKNFILAERRDFAPAYELLQQEEFTIYHLLDEGEKVGFISLWQLKGFTYVEHFVVYESHRNRGYGAKALTAVKEQNPCVVLEAELPEDEMTKRRIGFYQRNGFVRNEKPYMQPAYRLGGEEVPMTIMSYPTGLDNFENIVGEIYQKVYRKTRLR